MSDCYFNSRMVYTPLSAVALDEKNPLNAPGKDLDKSLCNIQAKLAQLTHPIDTFAHDLVQNRDPMSEDNSQTLAIVNTLRIMLGDLAGQISIKRRTHILRSLNLAVETGKDDPLVSLDDIAEQRQRTEALDKQFRRYQPPSTKAQGKDLSNKSPVNTGNRQQEPAATRLSETSGEVGSDGDHYLLAERVVVPNDPGHASDPTNPDLAVHGPPSTGGPSSCLVPQPPLVSIRLERQRATVLKNGASFDVVPILTHQQ
ncbi:hypothetical protein EDD21DRAFT_435788 [Dissophora ornata]|nr:hypothetical protein EDD21DRAFT_435788 [Dissophora ornata]